MEVIVNIDEFFENVKEELSKANDVAEVRDVMNDAKEFLMLCFAFRKRS